MFRLGSLRKALAFFGCTVAIAALGGCPPADTGPTVVSTSPADTDVGVEITADLSATFSEAMDPATITEATFTLAQGSTPVSGSVTYSGLIATFNPTSALLPNATYTATIAAEAAASMQMEKSKPVRNTFLALALGLFLFGNRHGDQADRTLGTDYVWTFTTGAAPETIPPAVSSAVPRNGAIGVPVTRDLSVTFSEAMDPGTIGEATFTLSQGATPVPGVVSYVGVTATFAPDDDLAPNTLYTASILMGATDLAGNPLAGDFVWSFTTGTDSDIIAPSVSSTDPAQGAVGVPLNKRIAAIFSEAMHPLLLNAASFKVSRGETPVPGTVTLVGLTATFRPDSDLLPDTLYTAIIIAQARDLAGNPLTGDFAWSFTTGATPDMRAPTVSSTDPANNATNVPLNKQIAATFSEPMDPATITSASFTLTGGATPIVGTVTLVGVTTAFTPMLNFAANTTYTATIKTDATDLAGNPLAANFVWSFTTGATPDTLAPTVSSTAPANNATNIELNRKVTATFSEAMDHLSINIDTFTVDDGDTRLPGAVTYAGRIATFTPSASLNPDTMYFATVWMEATDLAGNPLAADHMWTFTTGTVADTTPPAVVSTSPADGAMGVSTNEKIAATFSEAMNPTTVTTDTFTLTQDATPVQGTVSYVGVIATFTPNASLDGNTLYTATVSADASDLANNPLAEDFVWTFTTGDAIDAEAPTVISNAPMDGAIGVPLNTKVSATFSEPMDPLTITTATFTLDDGTALLSGSVDYAGDKATMTLAANLTPDTTYMATVSIDAADLSGNQLVEEFVWMFTTGATTAQQSIDLGSTNAFAILAGSTVSSTGATIITGDLGVSPGTAIVGFPPGVLNGSSFTGVDSAAGQAKEDLNVAFLEAAGRSVGPVSLPGDLGGLTLYPGLYTNSTSVMLNTGSVTLDAQGDANAVFLFQMGSTLTTGSNTEVVLAGGADAANVYWQVGTSATLGTGSIFKGNILAQESITLATGAALEGRALTQSAAVTLDAATITTP